MEKTTEKLCRICLQKITKESQFHILNNYDDLMLEAKLLQFVPQIDLTVTPNAILCQLCTNTIEEMHELKQTCLQAESNANNSENNSLALKFKDEIKEEYMDIADDGIVYKQQQFEVVKNQVADLPMCIKEEPKSTDVFYCHDCAYNTIDNENLIKHVQDRHLKTFQCDFKDKICNHKTKNKSSSKIHLDKHKIEKQYKCDKCDFSTHIKQSLINHGRTHLLEKAFKCTECDYSCKDSYQLKNHLLVHTDEKPFKCHKCNFVTKGKRYLTRHLNVYHDKKQHKCDKCDFSTYIKHCLLRHKRTHLSEKAYMCTQCDYRSNHSDNLKNHMLVHSDEKPFKCNICDFKTKHIRYLRRHSNVHK